MHHFPSLPFLSTPLAPHRRSVFVVPLSFLTFPFRSLHLQHTGSAFHSFKAIHHTHFCYLLFPFHLPTLFSRTPFGIYSTRAHPRKSTIHSFCCSGQPEFYTPSIRTPTDWRQRSARRSLASVSGFQQSNCSSYRLPLRTIWPLTHAELSAQESTQAFRKYAGR
jgi:hypothetical protein